MISTCVGCGKTYDNGAERSLGEADRCWTCAHVLPCRWCGKTWSAHELERPPGAAVPRCPCLLLRAHFTPKDAQPQPPAAAPAPEPACADCRHYRMALKAVASLAAQGVTGAGLGDIAELALNLPDERSVP